MNKHKQILLTLQKDYGNIESSTRLKALISALKLSQTQLADSIGLSRAQISHIIKQQRTLSDNIVYRIARKYPFVNEAWLLSGEGEMFLEAATGAGDVVAEPRAEYERLGMPELHRIIAEQGAEIRRLKEDVDRERAERLRLLGVVEALTKRD